MTAIKLVGQAYPAGTYYRLPTEEGRASIYAMEGSWYEAHALDRDGKEYLVIWDILDDGVDESDVCDWSNPRAIVDVDAYKDVTKQVKIDNLNI